MNDQRTTEQLVARRETITLINCYRCANAKGPHRPHRVSAANESTGPTSYHSVGPSKAGTTLAVGS